MSARRALRLGVVPYLNVAPIVHGLAGEARFQVSVATPARLAEQLHAGEIDLGMVPSIEYATTRQPYAIVPGIAIGSQGPVRSVSLFLKRPLGEVRTVALDSSSRTSVALLRIILRERLPGREPRYLTAAPPVEAMLEAADAALVIGDPALYFAGRSSRLDLGAEWQGLTGLPFVFAFWAGRPGAVAPGDVARLQAALRAGLADIPAIAASYNGHGANRAAENEAYLRSNIVFELGPAQRAGLLEFYRRAHGLGIIPRVPELRFHAEA